MFCSKCGAEVKDGMKFCPKCGAQLASTSMEPNAMESSGESDNARQSEKTDSPRESIAVSHPLVEGSKEKGFIARLFSLQGRATRGEWWKWNGLSVGIMKITLVVVAGSMWWATDQVRSVCEHVLIFTFLVISNWMCACVSVRRCHDIGISGWFALPLIGWWRVCLSIVGTQLVFLVGVLLEIIVLGIKSGVAGTNKYGKDPNALPELPPTPTQVGGVPKKIVVRKTAMKIKKMPQKITSMPQ